MTRFVVLAALLAPTLALAQADAERPGLVAPPPDDCFIAPPSAAEPAAPVPPGDFITSIFLETPTHESLGVPLNVILRLSGFFGDLDSGFVELVFEDTATQTPVAFTRSGGRVVPDAPLAPNTEYAVYSRFTDDGVCPDCTPQIYTFLTGTAEDHDAPPAPAELLAHALVSDQCEGFGNNHSLLIGAFDLDADIARVEVAAARRDRTPVGITDSPVFNSERFEVHTNLGEEPVTLGDAVLIALTPVDLAGNKGDATLIRVRARAASAFTGGNIEDLEPIQCSLDAAPTPALVGAAPRGGLVEVAFPFEASPVAVRQGDTEVALIPVEDTAVGQRLLPAETLGAGAWDLVPVDCPFCACSGCALGAAGALEVTATEDTEAPAAPVILGVDEVLDPAFAEGVCAPDDTAVIVRIEPGVDDATASEDLRYHAAIRVEDSLPVAVGAFLRPEVDGGEHVLRLETAQYGRLLTQPFELELTVVDLADREGEASFDHDGNVPAAGCSASGVPATGLPVGIALIGLLGLALRRRR
jgi:MYXO-CTERM domain-containing protein